MGPKTAPKTNNAKKLERLRNKFVQRMKTPKGNELDNAMSFEAYQRRKESFNAV